MVFLLLLAAGFVVLSLDEPKTPTQFILVAPCVSMRMYYLHLHSVPFYVIWSLGDLKKHLYPISRSTKIRMRYGYIHANLLHNISVLDHLFFC